MTRKTIVTLSAMAALCACGRAPDASEHERRPTPTVGFQKMIYDSQGFAVLRDRQTGCQWIAVLMANNSAEDMVPRNAPDAKGRVGQLCTSSSDPLSKPMKVDGDHGLFQEFSRDNLGTDLEVRMYRDVETGCEWIMTYTGYDRLKLIVRPRTMRRGDEVVQVCSPLADR